jgi:ketosteroid isomerase-like protein
MPSRGLTQRLAAATVAVAIFAGTAAFAMAKPAHHKRLAREEVEALEAQWKQASVANDLATMDKLLSDDYLGVTINGELVTKAQQLDRMRSHDFSLDSLDISDMKIKVIGQIAIVNALAQVQGTAEGHPLHGNFRYVRVYQHLPTGLWKITSFEVTRVPQNRRNAQTVLPPRADHP